MGIILQVDKISKSIGNLHLFSDVSFVINEGDKVAIIAKNGTGKSTLLNMIAGADTPNSGEIVLSQDILTAYLRQEPEIDGRNTVFNEVYHSSGRVVKAIRAYEKALLSGNSKEIDHATTMMDNLNAWDHEKNVKEILYRLRITGLDQKMETLSGGQVKRVALAQVLIGGPQFLILDEPTNHLDIDMIEWLEDYLQKAGCAMLMVTHDRYFLDRICTDIKEIDNSRFYSYSGNYSQFLQKRAERIENELAVIDKAKNLLRKETDWMNRMPKARGTKARYRKEAYYELKEQASAGQSDDSIKINIRASRIGKKIIEVSKLSFSWDGINYIKDFTYNFSRYEKIGIAGMNGTGKTTLLNLLTGKLKPGGGTIEHGETVVFGYVKQEGMVFDDSQKVIDIARSVAETVKLGDGRMVGVSQFLTQFMFPPEMQHNYVYKLSGGEKRRLYLLTVLMKSPNFLILDEPTNDLDIMSLGILEDYLQKFSGCVLVVSHDRYFMDQIVDHMFVFEGDGVIKDFPGNYTQYREHIERTVKKKKSPAKPTGEKTMTVRQKKTGGLTWKEKQEYERLEQDIEALEAEKAGLEEQLSSGSLSHEELLNRSTRIGDIMNEIHSKTERWIELGDRL